MRKITKGKYTLEHSIMAGPYGEPKDFFELTFLKDNGEKVLMPFFEPVRVNVTGFIFEPLRPYTDKEYEEMLDEQIAKYKEYYE